MVRRTKPSLHIDLHTHSTCSDGILAPAALVERAHARGVRILALTDHDDTTGLEEARERARQLGMKLVPGIELSVTWSGQNLHVLGLGIDPAAPSLMQGLARVRGERQVRAAQIAERLDALGIPAALEGARKHAHNPSIIGRSHFARFLVESGHAKDAADAFRRFLAAGKPAYVPHQWASLAEALQWIAEAGGYAVLAHPERYKLSRARLKVLLREFRDSGGVGMEIGSSLRNDPLPMLKLAATFGLEASVGSDFHGPAAGAVDVGTTAEIPPGHAVVRDLRMEWPAAA